MTVGGKLMPDIVFLRPPGVKKKGGKKRLFKLMSNTFETQNDKTCDLHSKNPHGILHIFTIRF